MTAVVPFRLRARAMSTLGGVYRIGLFVGPFVGSAVVALTGPWGAYAVHILAAVIAAGILLVVRDLSERPENRPDAPTVRALVTVVREQRSVLSTIGVGVLVVSAIRATRQVAIPLWGQYLGLSPATISLIFGVSGAVDMLLFYPAGKVMDRFGRLWVALPSVLVLGASLALVPLTQSAWWLTAVGLLMGVGNGMSSGIVMTLGADLSPPDQRPVFLGVWRVFSDSGNAAGPFVISGVTALATLGAGIVSMGIVGRARRAVARVLDSAARRPRRLAPAGTVLVHHEQRQPSAARLSTSRAAAALSRAANSTPAATSSCEITSTVTTVGWTPWSRRARVTPTASPWPCPGGSRWPSDSARGGRHGLRQHVAQLERHDAVGRHRVQRGACDAGARPVPDVDDQCTVSPPGVARPPARPPSGRARRCRA